MGPIARFFAGTFIVLATLVHFEVFPHPPTIAYLLALVPIGVLFLVGPDAIRDLTISVPPLLLAGWMVMSAAWTEDPERTAFLVRVQIPVLIGFMIVGALLSELDLMRFFLWAARLAVAISLAATIAFPSTRVGEQLSGEDLAGWHALFQHKNDMGPFIAMAFAIVLAADRRPITRYPTVALAGVLLVGSQSVTAITTALVVAAVFVWLRANRGVDDRAMSITIVSTTALAIGGAMGLRAGLPIFLEATGKDPTFSGRTDIWSAVAGAIGDAPLLGYGRGGLFFSPPNEVSLDLWRQIGFRAPHAHNGALDLASQLGLIGLALFGVVLIGAIRSSIRSYRRGEEFGLFALVTITAIVVASLSEPVFLGPYFSVLSLLRVATIRADRHDQLRRLRLIAAPRMGTGPSLRRSSLLTARLDASSGQSPESDRAGT